MEKLLVALTLFLVAVVFLIGVMISKKRSDGDDNTIPRQEAISTQKKKIIELVDIKTGYYHDYYPAIIMRWKNISSNNITTSTAIKVAFFMNNEELSQHRKYLHSYSDTPFERGTTRQIFIDSNIRLRSKGNIIAKIYVDDLLYDEVKVENQYLISNMLQ